MFDPYEMPPPIEGAVEVVCGSMFSGKTEELIRRLRRAQIAGLEVRVFKPAIDNRYATHAVASHEGRQLDSILVHTAREIWEQAQDAQVVGVDEAQFLDEEIVDVANALADRGKRVVLAGLDMDFLGRPFGPMPQLLAIADYVTKLHAVCSRTGRTAQFTFRRPDAPTESLVGGAESYQALCRPLFRTFHPAAWPPQHESLLS